MNSLELHMFVFHEDVTFYTDFIFKQIKQQIKLVEMQKSFVFYKLSKVF